MNRIFIFLVLTIWKANLIFAQDSVFVLNPAVGEKIDKNAKTQYFLFPEIKDSAFEYCIVKRANGEYFVTSHFTNDSLSTKKVDFETLKHYRENIEKLNEYYANKFKKDTSNNNEKKDLSKYNSATLKNEIVSPTLTEEQKGELRQNERLKSDADRMNHYMQGTELSPGNVELYNSNNKKKKKK